MSDTGQFPDCLICGHRVWKHNFYEVPPDGTPCPDCPDGTCPNMKPRVAPPAAAREDDR